MLLAVGQPDRQGLGPQAMTVARRAGLLFPFPPFVPPDLFAALLLVKAAKLQAGTETARAPAVFRVERKEPGVGFGKAFPAAGA